MVKNKQMLDPHPTSAF